MVILIIYLVSRRKSLMNYVSKYHQGGEKTLRFCSAERRDLGSSNFLKPSRIWSVFSLVCAKLLKRVYRDTLLLPRVKTPYHHPPHKMEPSTHLDTQFLNTSNSSKNLLTIYYFPREIKFQAFSVSLRGWGLKTKWPKMIFFFLSLTVLFFLHHYLLFRKSKKKNILNSAGTFDCAICSMKKNVVRNALTVVNF